MKHNVFLKENYLKIKNILLKTDFIFHNMI